MRLIQKFENQEIILLNIYLRLGLDQGCIQTRREPGNPELSEQIELNLEGKKISFLQENTLINDPLRLLYVY